MQPLAVPPETVEPELSRAHSSPPRAGPDRDYPSLSVLSHRWRIDIDRPATVARGEPIETFRPLQIDRNPSPLLVPYPKLQLRLLVAGEGAMGERLELRIGGAGGEGNAGIAVRRAAAR